MHADPAIDDNAGIGLAHQLQRGTLGRVFPHPETDRRGAAAEGQKAAGRGDHLAIGRRIGDLLRGDVALLHRGQDTHRDQMAVGGCVRDVAGRLKDRLREGPAHADQIVGGFWQDTGPRGTPALRGGRSEQDVLPFRIEVTVVPGDVFLDHRACRRMGGDILDAAFAEHPDFAAVAQRLAVIGAGAHWAPCPRHVPDRQRWRNWAATISE